MQPLVSIIIPTYNRAHLIGETLDSVLAQTYQNWECIVVDDGSTDATDELLEFYCEKDSRIQYHHRPKNRPKGANACRNYGFEVSKGEYVNWFDSDDVMMKDFLNKKRELFNEETDFVISEGCYVNENLENRQRINLNEEINLFKDYVLWHQHIITNSIMFKKNFLIGKDLFSLKITRGQEAEFFSRLFFQLPKHCFKIINLPLFLYRQHSNSTTSRDNIYINEYKESRSYIAIENLKRSLILKEKDLFNYLYMALIDLFFRGLENKHYSNSVYIIKNLSPILKKINKKKELEVKIWCHFFILLKRGSYKIERHLKNNVV